MIADFLKISLSFKESGTYIHRHGSISTPIEEGMGFTINEGERHHEFVEPSFINRAIQIRTLDRLGRQPALPWWVKAPIPRLLDDLSTGSLVDSNSGLLGENPML